MITKEKRQSSSKKMNLIMKKTKKVKKWDKTKVKEISNEKINSKK